jgi:C2 domain/Phosphatidylinositol-specific phospholipase C, Y domain
LVALNFQTADAPLVLNDGRFRVSGGCGYIRKPPSVMDTPAMEPPNPIELKIRVIHGTCLPKPFGDTQGEIIDPYVMVSLHDIREGSGADTIYEAIVDSQKTPCVDNNGFCPVFEHTCTFKVRSPECAMIHFDVREKDVAIDDKVGHSAIPFTCLRKGYRSIPLYDIHNTRSGAFGFAFLLVEISY